MKTNSKYAIVSGLIAIVLTFTIGELSARILGATVVYKYDKALGWMPIREINEKIKMVDQSGYEYNVYYSTNEYGFREFGGLESDKKRILIVGDSFTGDPYTSNEEAYFGILKQNLQVEIFAIGSGGYGTLQELMLIKMYSEIINPDILVLQFCSNDIENNSHYLEGPSIVRNQKNLRPYSVNGEIRYRLSSLNPYILLYKNSRLFRSVDALITTLQYKYYGSYYPPKYQSHDLFMRTKAISREKQLEVDRQKWAAIDITRNLMLQMGRSLPQTELITFTTSTDPEEVKIWEYLAKETGFHAYLSVGMRVQNAEENGEIVRVYDGAHWNRLGNRIAGEELARVIKRDFLQ